MRNTQTVISNKKKILATVVLGFMALSCKVAVAKTEEKTGNRAPKTAKIWQTEAKQTQGKDSNPKGKLAQGKGGKNVEQGNKNNATEKSISKWDRFWHFMSNGRDGRRKFGLGIGGTLGAMEYANTYLGVGTESTTDSYQSVADKYGNYLVYNIEGQLSQRLGIENQFAGFINVYAKYNLVDTKRFFLAIGVHYFDEVVPQGRLAVAYTEERTENYIVERYDNKDIKHDTYRYSSEYQGVVWEKVNSNISLKLDIGMNFNRFVTGYLSVGVSGLYKQVYYQTMLGEVSPGSDSFDAYPLLGLGIEYRVNNNFGIKMDYMTIFITNALKPVFENHSPVTDNMFLSYLTFGLHFYM